MSPASGSGRCARWRRPVEWVKRIPAPNEGDPGYGEVSEIEIRPVFEAADFGAEFTPELREQEERLRAQVEGRKKS